MEKRIAALERRLRLVATQDLITFLTYGAISICIISCCGCLERTLKNNDMILALASDKQQLQIAQLNAEIQELKHMKGV